MRITESDYLSTIGLIHDAALDSAAWDPLLRQLARLLGCVAGGLTVEDPATGRGNPITYFGFDPQHVARTFDRYLPMNPLFGCAQKMQPGAIIANGDVIRTQDFRRTEFYNGWAKPQGLCSPLTLVVHRMGNTVIPLTLVRPDGTGEATKADRNFLHRLAPHLMHAIRVSMRVQSHEHRLQAMLEMLGAMSGPGFLLDGLGHVMLTSPAADQMLADPATDWLSVTAGALQIQDASNDARLQRAVSHALGRHSTATGTVIEVARPGRRPISITVTPLPSAQTRWSELGMDGAGRARCLVQVEGLEGDDFARRFDLTPAETRLLDAVLSGNGLAWSAQQLGISRATAKSHLDRVFQKTNTFRQTELIALARQPGARRTQH
ncbi:helix-turn-helix transcriptional regulator [Acidisphaera sp. L21]|uniref:helix-turn-helix transcriptional regulator n=1 Tax=Acidisphaera sp. L21 TaxID=1641851 RepID=UPI00131C2E26|nr:helix-turn-helix transcriptional regulator [Acidisphaera sp. L21]